MELDVQGIRVKVSEEVLSRMMGEYLEGKGRSPCMPGEGIWILVDGAKINKDLFQKLDRPTADQRRFQGEVRAAGIHEGKYDHKKFYIMVPPMTWSAEEGVRLEELEKIAEAYGGRVAYENEVLLYLAMCVSNGVPWETICEDADKSLCYRVCRNFFQKLVWVGGSTLALEKKRHVFKAKRSAYVIDQVDLPDNWNICCTVPYVIIPYSEECKA